MRSAAVLFVSLVSLLLAALPGAAQELSNDDEKVRRPSCGVRVGAVVGGRSRSSSAWPMRRVVGYYEGWAARRIMCHAFRPEDVPAGVYSHLNFAFAGIDPVSFHVVPAQAEDVPLYSRLTALKKHDPALKVFITVGGWNFNNPGTATVQTFSQLVADEAKQRVFFASLISFLNTFNFDGVDIDWEYPGIQDRGGSAADYANFPRFLRNLRSALRTAGGGYAGLSITVPVSSRYLEHFDLAEIENWIDFFNVMSYDLHTIRDQDSSNSSNRQLGASLRSHTNMTEITQRLDHFWRAGVRPDMLTLGLAFHTRTYLASDPGCTTPGGGCAFDAVGPAGFCSRDEFGGTLTVAELTDELRAAGATPTLDADAMVKVAVLGRRWWITYDDEDTFRLKVDAARRLCLGGVAVWAVSQDYTAYGAAAAKKKNKPDGPPAAVYDARYSEQLQRATRYLSPVFGVMSYDVPGGF